MLLVLLLSRRKTGTFASVVVGKYPTNFGNLKLYSLLNTLPFASLYRDLVLEQVLHLVFIILEMNKPVMLIPFKMFSLCVRHHASLRVTLLSLPGLVIAH